MTKTFQKKARTKTKKTSYQTTERKAETRTKIQLGGLVVKSELAKELNITLGSDLQLEAENWDKAALLLSLLKDAYHTLLTLDEAERETKTAKGRLALKYDFFPEDKSLK